MRAFEETGLPELLHCGVFAGERNVAFHSHEGTELVLVTRGRCRIDAGEAVLEGGAGDLFVLPSRTGHNQINNGFVTDLYASFQQDGLFDESPRVVRLGGDRWVRRWMSHLVRLYHGGADNPAELASGILFSLLTQVGRMESAGRPARPHPALAAAMEYIRSHLDKTVDLGEMARHAGVSGSHLCALFRESHSKGPVAAALELKAKLAGRLLRDPHLSVKEAALRCGFDDPNYFSRFFRKHHGMSPEKYRASSKI